jgi:hypothetical protein
MRNSIFWAVIVFSCFILVGFAMKQKPLTTTSEGFIKDGKSFQSAMIV